MESVILIGGAETVAQQLRARTEADGVVLAHVLTADEALHELRRTDQSIAVLVLGPNLREPIQALQKIHALSSELAVIVLSPPSRLTNLKRAVMFAPLIGRHVVCLDASDTSRIRETVSQSITSARQRKSYLTLVTDLNQGLSSRRKAGPISPEAWKSAFVDRLLESVPLGIASIDETGTILSWNREASVIFSKTESEMIGHSLVDFFGDPEAKRTLRSYIRRAVAEPDFRSTPVVFEYLESQHTSRQSIEISVAAVQGKDHAAGAIVLLQDVTDRVQANRRLAEREELFRSFFNVAGVGIVQTDIASGRFLRANKKMQSIVGYSEPELQQMTFVDLTHPEDRTREVQAFRDFIDGTKSSYSVEKRYIRKDGQFIWASLNVELVRDASGTPKTMLGAVQDITDQRRSEDQLKEAVRSRDEFLSIASHELKTPLTSLKLQTQMRGRNLDKGNLNVFTPDRLRKMTDADSKQIDRLSRLIDDMLDISRISTGKLAIQRERFDLCTLAADVLEHYRPQFQATNSPVTLICDAPVVGEWDRFRIEQVITNLFTNAIRYGAGKPVEVSVGSVDFRAVISVKDQGIGVAKEHQSRIFERFERAVSASEISGLGLGLYIARQIVEMHDGTIRVESELGKGATFIVELPLAKHRGLPEEAS